MGSTDDLILLPGQARGNKRLPWSSATTTCTFFADTGATSNFITRSAVTRLNIDPALIANHPHPQSIKLGDGTSRITQYVTAIPIRIQATNGKLRETLTNLDIIEDQTTLYDIVLGSPWLKHLHRVNINFQTNTLAPTRGQYKSLRFLFGNSPTEAHSQPLNPQQFFAAAQREGESDPQLVLLSETENPNQPNTDLFDAEGFLIPERDDTTGQDIPIHRGHTRPSVQ